MLLNGNLKLIGSGEIQNLRVENLSTDPSSPVNGQLWYNTASGKLKYNDNGTIRILATGGDAGAIAAAVAQLQLDIAAETLARTNADTQLQANIESEALARSGADTQLQTNITAENTDRLAAELVITTALATETTGRKAAVASEETDRKAADLVLTNGLAAELLARGAADQVLQTNIEAEATARVAADLADAAALATEISDRTAAELVLTNAVAAEKLAREAADTVLTGDLADEATERAAAVLLLTTNLATEVSDRTAAGLAASAALAGEKLARETADGLRVLKAGDSLTGNLAFNGLATVTGLATPVGASDATTKGYVDSLVSGLSWKAAVNGSGIELPVNAEAGDRFLNLVDSKIYQATDTDTWNAGTDAVDGDAVFDRTDETGFVYSGTEWTQFTGSGQIAAGIGLVKNGNQIDVNLGAGIQQLPSDEVGVDLFIAGGLFLTEDGVTASTTGASQVSLHLDGTTLTKSADGVRVNATLVAEITAGTSGLATETAARIAADTELTGLLDDEVDARVAAELVLTNGLAAELLARAAADTQLQTNIEAENTARLAAGVISDAAIAAETLARTNADQTLTTNLAAEVLAREAAELVLTNGLAAEVLAREAADTAEAGARAASELVLTNGLAAELLARAAADTTLQGNIEAEATARGAADTALTTRLESCFFVYTGATADTTHVVTHAIGAKFCNVTVVDSADEVIIPQSIKYDSATQLTVTFNSAITCKVVVSGMAPAAVV